MPALSSLSSIVDELSCSLRRCVSPSPLRSTSLSPSISARVLASRRSKELFLLCTSDCRCATLLCKSLASCSKDAAAFSWARSSCCAVASSPSNRATSDCVAVSVPESLAASRPLASDSASCIMTSLLRFSRMLTSRFASSRACFKRAFSALSSRANAVRWRYSTCCSVRALSSWAMRSACCWPNCSARCTLGFRSAFSDRAAASCDCRTSPCSRMLCTATPSSSIWALIFSSIASRSASALWAACSLADTSALLALASPLASSS
mmetsp:Transcript_88476/g.153556  ORF Transcript_88476/g.153556 Transcript_88476/m.153556 type:complete len:265 (-) Transcript_88476:90-884(-)